MCFHLEGPIIEIGCSHIIYSLTSNSWLELGRFILDTTILNHAAKQQYSVPATELGYQYIDAYRMTPVCWVNLGKWKVCLWGMIVQWVLVSACMDFTGGVHIPNGCMYTLYPEAN